MLKTKTAKLMVLGRSIRVAFLLSLLVGVIPSQTVAQPEGNGAETLRVLSFADPLSRFIHPTDEGGYDGFDFRVLQSFAKSQGVSLEIVRVSSFDDLLPALLRGEGDIAAGSLTITPERSLLVDFSVPYFPVLEWVVANQRSEMLEGPEGLTGKIGSAMQATSLEARMNSLDGVEVLPVASKTEMYEAVVAGRADFTIDETVSALVILPNYPDLKRVLELPALQHYGFAMAPGNDLRLALDQFLTQTVGGESFYKLVLRFLGPAGVEALKRTRIPD